MWRRWHGLFISVEEDHTRYSLSVGGFLCLLLLRRLAPPHSSYTQSTPPSGFKHNNKQKAEKGIRTTDPSRPIRNWVYIIKKQTYNKQTFSPFGSTAVSVQVWGGDIGGQSCVDVQGGFCQIQLNKKLKLKKQKCTVFKKVLSPNPSSE